MLIHYAYKTAVLLLFPQDIAILTDNTDLCSFYQDESFNVKSRGICRGQNFPNGEDRPYSPHNNEEDCVGDEGEARETQPHLTTRTK